MIPLAGSDEVWRQALLSPLLCGHCLDKRQPQNLLQLWRAISVDRVSYKDARAKQSKNCRDCFNHFDAPSLERRMRMELMLATDRANALAASTCEAFSARRSSPSARALS